ncbi:hypothetical protein KJQ97_07065 [Campylobacter sp. 2018MI01]|uniref:uracil-DNA glycosylase family protein n=1 Tax=Campylobacter sp. 2018MI01 TaxID=2836735 RepID=UPI001BD9C997|nr:uracil-DNA glycosylase family protein [Campylobacter sp. 2018MI01]MBT0879177.1 hypothetical protein [Campylobacter sp. 2018MI01]
MDKNTYLHYLKLFGFSFYNDKLSVNKNYNIKDIKNCKLCNLYESKNNFYTNKVIKSNIFILSDIGFNDNDAEYFNSILSNNLNLNLNNVYITNIVKCSNQYKQENILKCYQYFLNELLESEANIIILLGENLINILQLSNFNIGDIIFYDFYGKKRKVLLNYSFSFIKKNPSYENDFINNLKKIKE